MFRCSPYCRGIRNIDSTLNECNSTLNELQFAGANHGKRHGEFTLCAYQYFMFLWRAHFRYQKHGRWSHVGNSIAQLRFDYTRSQPLKDPCKAASVQLDGTVFALVTWRRFYQKLQKIPGHEDIKAGFGVDAVVSSRRRISIFPG